MPKFTSIVVTLALRSIQFPKDEKSYTDIHLSSEDI